MTEVEEASRGCGSGGPFGVGSLVNYGQRLAPVNRCGRRCCPSHCHAICVIFRVTTLRVYLHEYFHFVPLYVTQYCLNARSVTA